MDNAAIEVASAIQSASIQENPDARYDVNPSTAASKKTPVHLHNLSSSSRDPSPSDDRVEAVIENEEVPVSVLEAPPRSRALPPLPDMRFEQSYLKRIEKCETWYHIAALTALDHVVLPFSQGLAWSLVLFGWRAWNKETQFAGRSVGARVRRWWWGVNGWTIPGDAKAGVKLD